MKINENPTILPTTYTCPNCGCEFSMDELMEELGQNEDAVVTIISSDRCPECWEGEFPL
jgi:transcription elongation factor Elf1